MLEWQLQSVAPSVSRTITRHSCGVPPLMKCVLYTGSNVTLECSAVGDPPPQVTWHKSGGTIPPNRTELLPGGLHLSHVRKGDEGVYICDMSNGVGQSVRHSAILQVQGKQKLAISHFKHIFCFILPFHSVCSCVYLWFCHLYLPLHLSMPPNSLA